MDPEGLICMRLSEGFPVALKLKVCAFGLKSGESSRCGVVPFYRAFRLVVKLVVNKPCY